MEKRKVLNQGFTKRVSPTEIKAIMKSKELQAKLDAKREELDREIHCRLVDIINEEFDTQIGYDDISLLMDTRRELYEQGVEFQINEGWQGDTYVVQIAVTQVATTMEVNFDE